MYNCLFLSLTCLCILPGHDAEECVTSILAKRGSVNVPKGGTLSLSCVVQHCGDDGWTGGWGLSTEGQFLLFSPTPRHHLSNVTLTTNRTRLLMDILNVNQSDYGMYQCQITWVEGYTSVGHMTHVNITAATPPTSVWKVYSRVAVYVSTCLVITLVITLVLVLGLACHRRSKVPSQPPPIPPPNPPPRSRSARKDKPPTPKPKPKIELVYAALSKGCLEQPNPNPQREAAQPTVYSSLRFS
uniref:uncharacterized protein LOC123992969 n=1 Tax=Oncorhynchus gorbuscha TaxID=8017 RepID=UPI001EAEF57E|nr:uncharacterized protein LOC123992969 [Oncorhynchus gorbuscha]